MAMKGLMPTPTVFDSSGASANMKSSQVKEGSMHSMTLARFVMLPTPTAVQRDHPERVTALHEAGAKTMMSRVNGECRPNSVLDALMFNGMLPTAQARDWNGASGRAYKGLAPDLPSIVSGMLPTPATRDYKGARTEEALENAGRGKNNSLPDYFSEPEVSAQLNPAFVGEMMGFPYGWTLNPFNGGSQVIGEPENFDNFPTVNPTIQKGEITDMKTITASKWRNESVKAFGNAVCPPLVFKIFQAINQYNSAPDSNG